MAHPFVRKLRHGARLTAEDEAILLDLAHQERNVTANSDIHSEGIEPRFLPVVLEGWACRYRMLETGRRQIVSLFLPGDLCEPFGALPRYIDHPFAALTPVTFAPVSLEAIGLAARRSPRIYEALWWDLLTMTAIEREFIVSMGSRSAAERMGHLFCELHLRLDAIGLVERLSYDFPLTQADIGELLGLSTVHVNRSLQDLRRAGWLSLRDHRLTIHNLAALRDFSLFDPAYLHLGGSMPSSGDQQPPLKTVSFP
jgi:CRP-like cAMP-binding protein